MILSLAAQEEGITSLDNLGEKTMSNGSAASWYFGSISPTPSGTLIYTGTRHLTGRAIPNYPDTTRRGAI